jgi:hypothetical protein
MPAPDDVVAVMVNDVRSAVTAATRRLQFTVLRIERGNVDLGRLIEELRELDVQIRRVTDLVAMIEASTPLVGGTVQAAET